MSLSKNAMTLALVSLLVGCDGFSFTTPDSDDLNQVESVVNNLSPSAFDSLVDYAMNRYAQKWLSDTFSEDDEVAALTCYSDKHGAEVEVDELTLYVNQVLECLRSTKVPSYTACVGGVMGDRLWFAQTQIAELPGGEEKYGNLRNCYYRIGERFNHVNVSKKLKDPDAWRSSELARLLVALTALELGRMPPLMDALGISTVGGALVAIPGGAWLVLCPLSDAVVCPDDPGAPGVPQPAPSPGGGDR